MELSVVSDGYTIVIQWCLIENKYVENSLAHFSRFAMNENPCKPDPFAAHSLDKLSSNGHNQFIVSSNICSNPTHRIRIFSLCTISDWWRHRSRVRTILIAKQMLHMQWSSPLSQFYAERIHPNRIGAMWMASALTMHAIYIFCDILSSHAIDDFDRCTFRADIELERLDKWINLTIESRLRPLDASFFHPIYYSMFAREKSSTLVLRWRDNNLNCTFLSTWTQLRTNEKEWPRFFVYSWNSLRVVARMRFESSAPCHH